MAVVLAGACGRLVGRIDLYPALAPLCPLPAPASGLQGENMMLLLDDSAAPWREGVLAYNDEKARPGQLLRSVRTEWRCLTVRSDGTPLELIDDAPDPHERANLANEPSAALLRSLLYELLTALPPAG